MLATTRNVDPRAPDLGPALRNGETLWTFPLHKAQWASNASNDTDLCYPDTASVEKRIEKVTEQRCDVGRSATQASFTPSTSPTKVSLGSPNRSGCLCKHATANLRAKLKSPKLSSWEDCSPSRSAANNQKCSESSSRSLSPCPLSYSNPCITSVYASHLFNFFTAWTIFMKLGTLVHHVHGYKTLPQIFLIFV